LAKEIDDTLNFLGRFEKYETYIVKSNHDEHIDKFLVTNDWRKLPNIKNALPYLEYSMIKLTGKADKGIVPYLISQRWPKFHCLNDNDNIVVKGYLMSIHGHIGQSGSRGSLEQYSRLSTKIVTGHSHTIGRIGGAVSVGTSTKLRLRYNKGASTWANAHGIVNRLGKFQHIIFFKKGDAVEFTTFN
jgi:hypothetical protein